MEPTGCLKTVGTVDEMDYHQMHIISDPRLEGFDFVQESAEIMDYLVLIEFLIDFGFNRGVNADVEEDYQFIRDGIGLVMEGDVMEL